MLGIACNVLIFNQKLKYVYFAWYSVVVFEALQNVYSKWYLNTTLFSISFLYICEFAKLHKPIFSQITLLKQ